MEWNKKGKIAFYSIWLALQQKQLPDVFYEKRCFPVKFVKFLRTPILNNTSGGCFYYNRGDCADVKTCFIADLNALFDKI